MQKTNNEISTRRPNASAAYSPWRNIRKISSRTKYAAVRPLDRWLGIDGEFLNIEVTTMKKFLMTIVATSLAAAAFAQVEPAVKETGKAVAESTKQAGDNVKAAVSTQPDKSVDKAKAQVHKAKARVHRHKAKKAADAAVH